MHAWNSEGNTAVHLVCTNNYDTYGDDMLMILGALGGSFEDVNVARQTPLHRAIQQGAGWDLVEVLHEFCPTLDWSPKDEEGNTPLHYIPDGTNANFAFLLKNGADANARNDEGDTPLHVFVGNCDALLLSDGTHSSGMKCIANLFQAGVSLSVKNDYGDTPMDIAISRASFEFQNNFELKNIDESDDEDSQMDEMERAAYLANNVIIRMLQTEERRREMMRRKCVGLAMGLSERLGAGSAVGMLNPDILCRILGSSGARTPENLGKRKFDDIY